MISYKTLNLVYIEKTASKKLAVLWKRPLKLIQKRTEAKKTQIKKRHIFWKWTQKIQLPDTTQSVLNLINQNSFTSDFDLYSQIVAFF